MNRLCVLRFIVFSAIAVATSSESANAQPKGARNLYEWRNDQLRELSESPNLRDGILERAPPSGPDISAGILFPETELAAKNPFENIKDPAPFVIPPPHHRKPPIPHNPGLVTTTPPNHSKSTIRVGRRLTKTGDVTFNVGDNSFTLPATDFIRLLAHDNNTPIPALDKFFVKPQEDKTARNYLVNIFDDISKAPPDASPSPNKYRWGRSSEIAAALQNRYRDSARFYLGDGMPSLQRAQDLPHVKGPSDIALIAPQDSFGVTDYGVVDNIKERWKTQGLTVTTSLDSTPAASNVVVLVGHHDAKLRDFVGTLKKEGILKGKVVLFATCNVADSEGFNTTILSDKGARSILSDTGARAVYSFSEPINLAALQPILVHMGNYLAGAPQRGISLQDLFNNAAESAKRDPKNVSLKGSLEQLQRSLVPQTLIMLLGRGRFAQQMEDDKEQYVGL